MRAYLCLGMCVLSPAVVLRICFSAEGAPEEVEQTVEEMKQKETTAARKQQELNYVSVFEWLCEAP